MKSLGNHACTQDHQLAREVTDFQRGQVANLKSVTFCEQVAGSNV